MHHVYPLKAGVIDKLRSKVLIWLVLHMHLEYCFLSLPK